MSQCGTLYLDSSSINSAYRALAEAHCVNGHVRSRHFRGYGMPTLVHIPFYTKGLFPHGTWREACNMCESIGGHLPVLRSREEQDQVMSFLKIFKHMIPISVMFIGLVNEKVSNIKNITS